MVKVWFSLWAVYVYVPKGSPSLQKSPLHIYKEDDFFCRHTYVYKGKGPLWLLHTYIYVYISASMLFLKYTSLPKCPTYLQKSLIHICKGPGGGFCRHVYVYKGAWVYKGVASTTPPKKLLRSGFSIPYTLLRLICTMNSELKYFPIFTHLPVSELGSISTGFWWMGSTPARF